jgi:hypothetical protein
MTDFESFKTDDGGEPPDGTHTAWLERTSVFDSKAGQTFIRACWRTTDMAYYWESLHGTEGNGKPHTQRLLGALGIDLEHMGSWDQVGDELAVRENIAFLVGVKHNGNFLNTTVEGRPDTVQPEIPPDDRGLPEPAAAGAQAGGGAGDLFGDDDIPF